MYFWYLWQERKLDKRTVDALMQISESIYHGHHLYNDVYGMIRDGGLIPAMQTLRRLDLPPDIKIHYWREIYFYTEETANLIYRIKLWLQGKDSAEAIDRVLRQNSGSREVRAELNRRLSKKVKGNDAMKNEIHSRQTAIIMDLVNLTEAMESVAKPAAPSRIDVSPKDEELLRAAEREVDSVERILSIGRRDANSR